MAALGASPAAAMASMQHGMDHAAFQLQYYRMLRTVAPDQLERMFPPEIRERFDMALKAQVCLFLSSTLRVWVADE